jgi:hypothetical protein
VFPDPLTRLLVVVAGIAVALAALAFSLAQARRWRMVRDLPKSHAGGVMVGMVDVSGAVRATPSLTSHLAELACAWYRWSVEERWSRLVTTTSTDAKGHTTTSTHTESGWRTVGSGGEQVPFALEDETGRVRVLPQGASVDAHQALSCTVRRSDPLYYAKGPQEAISDSDHVRRFQEDLLPVDVPCSVIGYARQSADLSALEIARDARARIFAISLRGSDAIGSGYRLATILLGLGGLAAALVTARLACGDDALAIGLVAAGAAYLGAAALGWLWLAHNSLVELRQRVHQGWANVDVQLEKRFDLIHELMPLVSALGEHEASVQAMVAAMRSQLIATAPGAAGPDALALAPRLTAVAEAYPHLVAQPQYARLHATLVQCEDAIALARTYYNDIATSWNARTQRVPDVIAARLFHCLPAPLMVGFTGVEAPAPRVDLASGTAAASG